MRGAGTCVIVNGALHVEWTLGDGARLHLVVNFGDAEALLPEAPGGDALYREGARRDGGALRISPDGVSAHLEAGR